MSFLIVGGNTATHPEYESCFPYQKKPSGPWRVSFLAETMTNHKICSLQNHTLQLKATKYVLNAWLDFIHFLGRKNVEPSKN